MVVMELIKRYPEQGIVPTPPPHTVIRIPDGVWLPSEATKVDACLAKHGWQRRGMLLVSNGTRYPLTIFKSSGQYVNLISDGDHVIVLKRHPMDLWRQYASEVMVMRETDYWEWRTDGSE